MIKGMKIVVSGVVLSFFVGLIVFSQKVEVVDGVRVVHNGKKGLWGDKPKVSLQLIRTVGELDALDENIAFYLPSDVAIDPEGNIYILDTGNHRIQKFSPSGQYLATLGRKGQGPGEFFFPRSLDVDEKGYIYVSDPNNKRIQVLTPEGKEHQTLQLLKEGLGIIRCASGGRVVTTAGSGMVLFKPGEEESRELPKLIQVIDSSGKVEREFGATRDYGNFLLNRTANQIHFAVDKAGNIFLAFSYQNRIEKLSPEGKPLWRADRELDYSTEPKDKGKIERRGGSVSIQSPQLNKVSEGIAVDGMGRAWVVGLRRQLKKEEQVGIMVGMSMAGGQRSMTMKAAGKTELRETDAYQLEIYEPEGVLLGTIPLEHFVDGIRIEQERLFLIDQMRGAKVFEYRIEEKK